MAFAAAALLIAFLARLSLDPMLENGSAKHAFITFIVATTVVAWYSGFVPSLLTFVGGFLLAAWYFLEPNYSLHFTTRLYAGHHGSAHSRVHDHHFVWPLHARPRPEKADAHALEKP